MDISDDLARRLANAGRDWLGSGDAALVVGCGPTWALKLGYDGADAWPTWARWCAANPGPHLPVIGGVEVLVHDRRMVGYVGLVERLRPTLVAARWLKADRLLKRDPVRLAGLVEAGHPSIAAMLRQVAAAFPNVRWDMAPSNWMERESGVLVLTDPMDRLGAGLSIGRAA